jgi:hypothetical protein
MAPLIEEEGCEEVETLAEVVAFTKVVLPAVDLNLNLREKRLCSRKGGQTSTLVVHENFT